MTSSIASFDFCVTSLYLSRSSGENSSMRGSSVDSGSVVRIAFVRRKQIEPRRVRKFLRPSKFPAFKGSTMDLLNVFLSSKGERRRNFMSDSISSSLFCTGVPVKHQRCLADKENTARNWFVERQRMM